VVRLGRYATDQVGLGSRARGRNVAGRVSLRRSARVRVAGRVVVLVDDVVTTGATLAACEAALTRAGGRVVAAVTLAATPAPRSRSGRRPPAATADTVLPAD